MRIAVIGGGITGLTSSYYLSKKGHTVTVFEKGKQLGGLCGGFYGKGWSWPLDYAYHHVFANDNDILDFAKEIGFDGFYFSSPETASLFPDMKVYPFDTPKDLLVFPHLSAVQKIKTAATLAFLKAVPSTSLFEKMTARRFLRITMGSRVWNVLWRELFRKKFGKYAGNILASFIWARIKKRTKRLGYVKGGFQALVDFIEKKSRQAGTTIYTNTMIDKIKRESDNYIIGGRKYDAVIATVVSPIIIKTAGEILPKRYTNKLSKTKYLQAVVLIIDSNEKLLEKTYWLNICAKEIPIMGVVQHTNFVDKKHYGGSHILYIANYVDENSRLLKMDKEKMYEYFLPHLRKINSRYSGGKYNLYLFRAPYSQPIIDKSFLHSKPEFETPLKNFYIANLDMTYPYDRGTNFSVKLGKEVATLIG